MKYGFVDGFYIIGLFTKEDLWINSAECFKYKSSIFPSLAANVHKAVAY